MYEDEKNVKTNVNESITTGSKNDSQWNANNTSASDKANNNYGQGGYGAGQNNGYSYNGGAYGGSGYYNSQNGYNQGTSGNKYTYGQGSYSQSGYENRNFGKGSYNQSAQQTYGTYQYSSSNQNGPVPQAVPVKKKHTLAKIIAAVCALALVVGGVGFAYNSYFRMGRASYDKEDDFAGTPDSNGDEKVAEAETEEKTEKTEQASENASDIDTTTVSGQTMAVVTDVTGVVEEVMPAMVIIHNNYTASANFFGYTQTEEATASGSGIIVGENDSELLIATNYHVIEGADSLEVIFTDESTVNAVVKGTDSDMDLAVIAVILDDIDESTREEIKIATLGDSQALKLGEPAIAIGNALGYGQSVTTGVISALNREVEIEEGSVQTFIQTDAAINPGNSGGALLNLQGEVIGINSNKIGGDTVEGMGYAIPISVAQPIIDKLMNEETKIQVADEDRGYIGISGVSVTPDVTAAYGIPQGVYVAEVSNGGGAQASGIEKGDVITEFDGEEITSMDDLQTRLQYYAAGTEVVIKVLRQNGSEYDEYTYNVTLGSRASLSGADSNAAEESEKNGSGFMPGNPNDKDSHIDNQGNDGAGASSTGN